jgi:hypothetical protein
VLFFLCKGTTCASLSLSGNVDVSKDLFIILEMGFATADLDNFKILEDIPSFPVAFFISILLISLLTNSPLMGLKINWSVLFYFIAFILGWLSSVFMFCEPMSLATFMKKLLKVSATSVWLFIILSFSHKIMSLAK